MSVLVWIHTKGLTSILRIDRTTSPTDFKEIFFTQTQTSTSTPYSALQHTTFKMATNGTSNGNGTTSIARVDPEQVTKMGMAAYRAPSLLQPHRAQEALQDAHDGRIPPLIGFFCGLACPPVAKVVAQLGFDIVWIDWEHASMNIETMTQVCHASPNNNNNT